MMLPSSQHTRVIYSTAAGDGVAQFVAGHYPVAEPLACSLLNRGFNDSFLVQTANGEKYVLRISREGRKTEADINSETSFIAHLDRMGVPVAAPVAARNGGLFTTIAMPEGQCFVVMFRFLEDRNPRHDDPGDAALQGQTLARIHLAAESFEQAETYSQRTDLTYLLDRPLKAILTLNTLEPRTRDTLLKLAERLAAQVKMSDGLSLITCHGDCHGSNARIVKSKSGGEEAAFFDFDEGGFGYLTRVMAKRVGERPL